MSPRFICWQSLRERYRGGKTVPLILFSARIFRFRGATSTGGKSELCSRIAFGLKFRRSEFIFMCRGMWVTSCLSMRAGKFGRSLPRTAWRTFDSSLCKRRADLMPRAQSSAHTLELPWNFVVLILLK